MQLSNGSVLFTIVEGQVLFAAKQLDGSWGYDYVGENRVANTKFLLKCFQEAKERYKYLYCTAYSEDEKGSTRNDIFLRVGFEHRGWGDGTIPALEWGEREVVIIVAAEGLRSTYVGVDHLKDTRGYSQVDNGTFPLFTYSQRQESSFEVIDIYLSNTEASVEDLGLKTEDWERMKAEGILSISSKALGSYYGITVNPETGVQDEVFGKEVQTEGHGFVKAIVQPWTFYERAIDGSCKWCLHVTQNLEEFGWAKAVPLSTN